MADASRPVVVTIGHRFPDAAVEEEALEGVTATVNYLGGRDKEEALASAKGAAVILLGASFRLEAADMERLVGCQAVVRYGVGVDNIDLAAAEARGIVVCNVPDYATAEVADHTLALLLALARGLDIWAEAARQGHWGRTLPRVSMPRLSDTTLGVIGAGRIGQAVVVRAVPFWARVLAYDPFVTPDIITALGAIPTPLESVLAESDFLTLHLPSTPETRGFLSAERLRTMKRGSVLVNCSRGDLVDEAALAACLADGHIRRAGLDVFAEEPPDTSGMIADAAVWPTPHVAYLSTEALRELRRRAALEARRILRNQPPRNRVV